jgi:hypothetical protein
MSTIKDSELATAAKTISRQQRNISEMRDAIARANAYFLIGHASKARNIISECAQEMGITGRDVIDRELG